MPRLPWRSPVPAWTKASCDSQVQTEGQDRTLEDQAESVLSFLHVTMGRIVDVSYYLAGVVSDHTWPDVWGCGDEFGVRVVRDLRWVPQTMMSARSQVR